MSGEAEPRERLRKIEALFAGAGTSPYAAATASSLNACTLNGVRP